MLNKVLLRFQIVFAVHSHLLLVQVKSEPKSNDCLQLNETICYPITILYYGANHLYLQATNLIKLKLSLKLYLYMLVLFRLNGVPSG